MVATLLINGVLGLLWHKQFKGGRKVIFLVFRFFCVWLLAFPFMFTYSFSSKKQEYSKNIQTLKLKTSRQGSYYLHLKSLRVHPHVRFRSINNSSRLTFACHLHLKKKKKETRLKRTLSNWPQSKIDKPIAFQTFQFYS